LRTGITRRKRRWGKELGGGGGLASGTVCKVTTTRWLAYSLFQGEGGGEVVGRGPPLALETSKLAVVTLLMILHNPFTFQLDCQYRSSTSAKIM